MARYGLKRGIEGSTARHVNTSQYYRNLYSQSESLQEDIQTMLQVEERVRKDIEELNRKKIEGIKEYEELGSLTEEKQSELKTLKKGIATQKLKNKTTEVAVSAIEKLGSLVHDKKGKEQVRKIVKLESEKQNIINQNRELRQQFGEREKELRKENEGLKSELGMLYECFPFLKTLKKWWVYCKELGFGGKMLKRLMMFQPIRYTGEIRNPRNGHDYELQNTEIYLAPEDDDGEKITMRIDDQDHVHWFREKRRENMPEWERQLDQNRQQSKGFKMR